MAVTNRIFAVPAWFIDAATFTGGYDLLCSGLNEACFLIRIINTSNRNVVISYDGTNAHDYVPTGTQMQLSFQANSRPKGNVALMAQGQRVYVSAAAGTGYVYLSGYYSVVQ